VCEGVDWTLLAQDRDRWRAVVNTLMKLRVPWKAGNFLTRWETFSQERLCAQMKSKGFWRWCVIICNSVFFWTLYIVYILIKLLHFGSWIFFRLQVKRKDRTLAVGPPGWATLRPLPEDGRRSSFRNVVILLKYRRWTKSKKKTAFTDYFAYSSRCIITKFWWDFRFSPRRVWRTQPSYAIVASPKNYMYKKAGGMRSAVMFLHCAQRMTDCSCHRYDAHGSSSFNEIH
jgi:hypothetical protein